MILGYGGLNCDVFDNPDSITRFVTTAEQVGFESVWTGEHIVLLDPQVAPSPLPPEPEFMGTLASLAFAAAKTSRIKIGTGIMQLPQHDPVVLAKELATASYIPPTTREGETSHVSISHRPRAPALRRKRS